MNEEKLKQLKKFLNELGWDMGLFDTDEHGQLKSMVIGEAKYIGQLVEDFTNDEALDENGNDPTLH